jgi:tyrosyl-tRNA synthetase
MNNADWLRGLGLMEFLRDTGKHFTVNYMLQKDSVQSRMETGISFTEFSYMLVQAYDFWHLFRTAGCELQMGGSDQWGNITAGIELIGRREQGSAHGLVMPLLTTSGGAKFGKSEDGNVWLDPARTSPYKFFQFWLNTDDRDVERLLNFFTFLSSEEIGTAMKEQAADPSRRTAQRLLAHDITSRVHGEETTARVIAASAILFGGTDLRAADAGVFDVLSGEMPTTSLPAGMLDTGLPLVDALVTSGLASSKSDARRGIQGKGFAVNGEKTDDVERVLTSGDLLAGGYVMLQKGKKNYALLRAE